MYVLTREQFQEGQQRAQSTSEHNQTRCDCTKHSNAEQSGRNSRHTSKIKICWWWALEASQRHWHRLRKDQKPFLDLAMIAKALGVMGDQYELALTEWLKTDFTHQIKMRSATALNKEEQAGMQSETEHQYLYASEISMTIITCCKESKLAHIAHESLERGPHSTPHPKDQDTYDHCTIEP